MMLFLPFTFLYGHAPSTSAKGCLGWRIVSVYCNEKPKMYAFVDVTSLAFPLLTPECRLPRTQFRRINLGGDKGAQKFMRRQAMLPKYVRNANMIHHPCM